MSDKTLYVVQIRKNKRWQLSFWTHGGKPVSKRAALNAKAKAERQFPESEYRIKESA